MDKIATHAYYLFKGLFAIAADMLRGLWDFFSCLFILLLFLGFIFSGLFCIFYWLSLFMGEPITGALCSEKFPHLPCFNYEMLGEWSTVFFIVIIMIVFFINAYHLGKELAQKEKQKKE